MASRVRILNPTGQNFTCHNCGLCCTTPWKVKVAPERVPTIESTEHYQHLQREGFIPLPVVEAETRTGRRQDGSCLFRHNNGCAIHGEKGGSAKPVVCQLFPYSLINSPDGYYLSLSFSCPSVIEGSGTPVSDQLDQISEVVASSSYFPKAPMSPDSHVALTQQRAVSWRQYIDMETDLLESLNADDPVLNILKSAVALIYRPFEGQPTVSGDELLSQVQQIFPFYACYTIATLEYPNRQDKADDFCRELMQGRALSSRLLGGKALPPFCLLRPTDETTTRYIRNFVLGKQLIAVAPMVARLLTLSVAIAVFLFYQKARLGEAETTQEALAWCFHLIEASILGHSDILAPLYEHFEREVVDRAY